VRDAVKGGVPVVPIPGPSAALAALSASGLPTASFAFEGFLPSRQGKRREKLALLKNEQRLLVFYESPNRLPAALADMAEILGEREAVVAREMTKVYEEFVRGSLSHVADAFSGEKVKGEVVVLVAPAVEEKKLEEVSFSALLEDLLASGDVSVKDAVKRISLATGAPRGEVYDEALRLKKSLS
jgi:16S rRNA (cytidine1402-2'-O)-methyltransferase